MVWVLSVTRWTMHGLWPGARVSGLILGSTLRLVWLDQRHVVQQVEQSACGWKSMSVLTLLEPSPPTIKIQDYWSFAQMTFGMQHMYYYNFHVTYNIVTYQVFHKWSDLLVFAMKCLLSTKCLLIKECSTFIFSLFHISRNRWIQLESVKHNWRLLKTFLCLPLTAGSLVWYLADNQ